MTASAYETFLSNFKNGMMKPNRYRVEFHLPRGVSNSERLSIHQFSNSTTIRQLDNNLNGKGGVDIKCHTATFPQRSLQTYEHIQNSAPFRVPYSAAYDPVTFSFYVDGNGDTREYFDTWQNAVINVSSNTLNFWREFVSDITIYAMNEAGEDTYGVTLYDAYPLNVGAMELSYTQSNNYQTSTVTIAYKSWSAIRAKVKPQRPA